MGAADQPDPLQGYRRPSHRLRRRSQQADPPHPDDVSAAMERAGSYSADF